MILQHQNLFREGPEGESLRSVQGGVLEVEGVQAKVVQEEAGPEGVEGGVRDVEGVHLVVLS